MKYAPKKVFIKENENYIEITNEEHERRKATDEQYAKSGNLFPCKVIFSKWTRHSIRIITEK